MAKSSNRLEASSTGEPVSGIDARCRDCDAVLSGRFCAECGLDRTESTPGLGGWIRETTNDLFSMNSRLARTARPLLFRPGFLTRAWIDGKRQRYTRPIRLFLIVTLMMLGVSELRGADDGQLASFLHAFIEAFTDEATDRDRIESVVRRDLRWIGLLMVPVTASLLALLYWRRPFSWHVVFTLHLFAALFVGRMVQMLLTAVPALGMVTTLLLIAYLLVYAALAMRAVYESPWWKIGGKLVAALTVSAFIWALVGFAWIAMRDGS